MGQAIAQKKRKKSYSLSRAKFLTADEYKSLIELLWRNITSPDHYRDCILLLVAVHTGARATEILNLSVGDFDFVAKSLYICGIKGSKDREIPLPLAVANHLQAILTDRMSTEKIFPISYKRFYQIWLKYRPANKNLHCLRHTFAVRVFTKTKDMRLLQIALGHKSILNTAIYTDFVYSQGEMKKLVE